MVPFKLACPPYDSRDCTLPLGNDFKIDLFDAFNDLEVGEYGDILERMLGLQVDDDDESEEEEGEVSVYEGPFFIVY